MKKILVLCIFVLMSMHANASTLCAADNTIPIVLNPEIGRTSYKYNDAPGEFSITFPYGTIYGVGTCVSTKPNNGNDLRKTLVDTTTGKVVTGREELGQYCWCQITHPVKTYWMPSYNHSETLSCVSGCASDCVLNSSIYSFIYNYGIAYSNSSARQKLFSTIGK